MRTILKITRLVCLCVLAVAVMCGCSLTGERETSVATEATEPEYTLCDRQKEILASKGLPTEYGSLTWSQKQAITAIEEMLQAVEQKYGTEFAYAGYIADGILEPEQLFAYPVGEDSDTETFVVTRETVDGTVVYHDTHLLKAGDEMFAAYVETALKEMTGSTQSKVYLQLTRLTLDALPSSNEQFDGCTAAEILIFFDAASCSMEQLSGIIEGFEAWMKEHRLYGTVQYILLNENLLPSLNRYNYTNYLLDDYYQAREFSYLNRRDDK